MCCQCDCLKMSLNTKKFVIYSPQVTFLLISSFIKVSSLTVVSELEEDELFVAVLLVDIFPDFPFFSVFRLLDGGSHSSSVSPLFKLLLSVLFKSTGDAVALSVFCCDVLGWGSSEPVLSSCNWSEPDVDVTGSDKFSVSQSLSLSQTKSLMRLSLLSSLLESDFFSNESESFRLNGIITRLLAVCSKNSSTGSGLTAT